MSKPTVQGVRPRDIVGTKAELHILVGRLRGFGLTRAEVTVEVRKAMNEYDATAK